MKFLIKKREHKYYLLISVLLIILFFLGYRLVTNKITSEAEDVVEVVIKQYAKEKKNILEFDFNDFNKFISDTQKIIENSYDLDENQLKNKIILNSELVFFEDNIDASFVYFLKENKITFSSFFGDKDKEFEKNILKKVYSLNGEKLVFDSVINSKGKIYYRKTMICKISDGSVIVFGYDINLLKYWGYFSQKHNGEGGYVIVTNKEGVCLLHPETKYIGKLVNSFFDKTSLNQIHKELEKKKGKKNQQIKTIAISEYLNLEVLRYYDVIHVGESELVSITSFPINIFIKESVNNIKQYLLWVGFLVLLSFILILGFSRNKLRYQYFKMLKYEQEKQKLAISNEQYQQKNAKLQLSQLRKKLNPHFLFNSLNSLHALIDIDKETSQEFVLKLSEVYRYLLKDKDANFATVKEELYFLKQYFFLNKIRFNNKINLEINYRNTDNVLLKKIPFLALQTLAENAIKHNKITKIKPLLIEVLIEDDRITISNYYNPRINKKEISHSIGLSYLNNFYNFHGINSFKTVIAEGKFKCYLPLLSK